MAWKTLDVREQRVRFVIEAVQARQTFRALCARYEISPPTGYLWLQRYRQKGVEGIAEHTAMFESLVWTNQPVVVPGFAF